MAHDLFALIVARFDGMAILYQLDIDKFDLWRFDFTGVVNSLVMYLNFFLSQESYENLKQTLETSSSVVLINSYSGEKHLDFVKTIALDVFLSMGLLGLVFLATLLGILLTRVQHSLLYRNKFSFFYLLGLYLLPLTLQVEKEFTGLLFSFIKWSPYFLIIYLFRPKIALLSQPHSSSVHKHKNTY
jgi:hypothetical protein